MYIPSPANGSRCTWLTCAGFFHFRPTFLLISSLLFLSLATVVVVFFLYLFFLYTNFFSVFIFGLPFFFLLLIICLILFFFYTFVMATLSLVCLLLFPLFIANSTLSPSFFFNCFLLFFCPIALSPH